MGRNGTTPDKPSVIVDDDEPDLCAAVSDHLGRHGFSVRAVGDGAAFRAAVGRSAPDIALLDISLPGEDGLSLARFLRGAQVLTVGIVRVTAAGEVVDRVVGLEIGADDQVAKPFDLRELLARVRAAWRKVEAARAAVVLPARPAERIPFGPLNIDVAARKALDERASRST